jgi:hypothetical protein
MSICSTLFTSAVAFSNSTIIIGRRTLLIRSAFSISTHDHRQKNFVDKNCSILKQHYDHRQNIVDKISILDQHYDHRQNFVDKDQHSLKS